ncbi:MAG: TetR/AcrR family transcriptional regulator [Bryobacteraceae bacterium]
MTQPRTKQEAVAEFRSGEILEAARKVFASKGFGSATVDDIAESAHISKGTVYLYFRSKRDLYLAALQEGVEEIHEQTNRRMALERSARDKLRAFVETRIYYFERNRDFFKICQSEFGNLFTHPSQLNEAFTELHTRQTKALEAVVAEAIRCGELRPVRADLAAFTIYEMTRGLIIQRLMGWSQAPAEADIDSLFDLIWKGIQP